MESRKPLPLEEHYAIGAAALDALLPGPGELRADPRVAGLLRRGDRALLFEVSALELGAPPNALAKLALVGEVWSSPQDRPPKERQALRTLEGGAVQNTLAMRAVAAALASGRQRGVDEGDEGAALPPSMLPEVAASLVEELDEYIRDLNGAAPAQLYVARAALAQLCAQTPQPQDAA